MSEPFKYPGNELELFQHATRWKNYFAGIIRPFTRGTVLEAGAGIGSNTLLLKTPAAGSWILLEPDTAMCSQLKKKQQQQELPADCSIVNGTIQDLAGPFDTILYIDVLEHIEDDRQELQRAAALLNPGGHLVVLSPAFPHLFSPFDRAIGHYRRYTKKMMRKLTPQGLELHSNRYYDSVGYFASVLNKVLLRQQYPSIRQVQFWDRWMVPVSRVTDQLCFHAFGKCIIAVWKK